MGYRGSRVGKVLGIAFCDGTEDKEKAGMWIDGTSSASTCPSRSELLHPDNSTSA